MISRFNGFYECVFVSDLKNAFPLMSYATLTWKIIIFCYSTTCTTVGFCLECIIFKVFLSSLQIKSIRCTQGGGPMGRLIYPLKNFKKTWSQKCNKSKTQKQETPWILSQPYVPLQKTLKMTVHLCYTIKMFQGLTYY